MHIGIYNTTTDYELRPGELALACEARGFESLWFPEHTHLPTLLKAPLPVSDEYRQSIGRMTDPFVSLMAAASTTQTLLIGTGVCLVALHDPIILAKTVATLDLWSSGRLLFGVGAGWIEEEAEHHNVPFTRRGTVMREHVEAIKQIWTQEEASYNGEFVKFERIVSHPKPLQKPHPPILVAGSTPQARQRAVNFGNAWAPAEIPMDELPAALTDLAQRANAAGRDPTEIPVSLFTFEPLTVERVERYQEIGLERVVVVSPDGDVLPFLDRMAELILKAE